MACTLNYFLYINQCQTVYYYLHTCIKIPVSVFGQEVVSPGLL